MTFTPEQLMIGLILIVAIIAGLWFWSQRRTSAKLKSQFGPEYERTVQQVGDEKKAETVLADRQKRVSSFTIKPMPSDMRQHFIETWPTVQAKFVDDPKYAVTRADDLLGEVMSARGYPMSEFDQRADDLSVDHPEIVQNYRKAHDIAVRHSRGEASTEDLRTAMIHYRTLFDDLVNEPALNRAQPNQESSHV